MPVVSNEIDVANRSITIITELRATPDSVWQLWADAARFANWWGPEGYPLTVTEHDLRAEGAIVFHVSFPDDTAVHARLDFTAVEPSTSLTCVFTTDGLEDPTDIHVVIETVDDVITRMTVVASYRETRALDRARAIGFDKGFARSVARADVALG